MTNFAERTYSHAFIRDRQTADAAGVYLSTSKHPAATIVTVRGDIDASNAGLVTDFVAGVIDAAATLVLDLSDADFLAVEGFRALLRIQDDCLRAGVLWVLVTSEAVDWLLDVLEGKHRLPAMRSLDAALHHLTACARAKRAIVTPVSRTRC